MKTHMRWMCFCVSTKCNHFLQFRHLSESHPVNTDEHILLLLPHLQVWLMQRRKCMIGYLPTNKTLWKCTADQENMNTNKNPYEHQTNANRKVNQQKQENHRIFGKPVKEHTKPFHFKYDKILKIKHYLTKKRIAITF